MSLPAAEVSLALARDAIDAMASRARRHAERPRPTIRTRTRRTFPRETDRDRALEHAIAPREPTRPFRFRTTLADRRPFSTSDRTPLSNQNTRQPTNEAMLFYSYFKTLVGKQITVELKNDLAIGGTLVSVDQYLNIKLENTKVVDENRYPHMRSVRNCFIRGSVVRYVQLPAEAVDVDILHDATRREARGA